MHRLISVTAAVLVSLTCAISQQPQDTTKVVEAPQLALAAPESTTAYDPFFQQGRGVWERDYLVYVHAYPDSFVDLYDKDTFRASIKISIPNARSVSLSDASVSPGGKLIVSGCALLEDGARQCFVGRVDREGQLDPMLDTRKYAVTRVSACDDSTVWAMGWVRINERESTRSYPVLRQYRLSDGKRLTAALDRASFPKWPGPALRGLHELPDLTMQCRGTTVGIYEGATDEWIEYDTSRGVLSRWKLPQATHPWAEYDADGHNLPERLFGSSITGVAMLDSGKVYASFVTRNRDGSAQWALYQLRKEGHSGEWLPIGAASRRLPKPSGFKWLNGTDGRHLVYSRFDEPGWFFSAVEPRPSSDRSGE